MRIAAVGAGFPDHYYDQEALLAAFRQHWETRYFNPERIEQLHRNVLVGGRHLALPMEDYPGLAGFGAANDAWIRVATDVGERALADGLAARRPRAAGRRRAALRHGHRHRHAVDRRAADQPDRAAGAT